MFDIKNNTPFQSDIAILSDKNGINYIVAMVKTTYSFDKDNKVTLTEEQMPIQKGDEYYGEEGLSSIKYASDITLCKTGTDIVLVGHVYTYKRPATQVDATLRVGSVEKRIRVYGDRHWKYRIGLVSMTRSEPFDKMPIIYERAFGGADKTHSKEKRHVVEQRNPVGRGFRVNKTKESIDGLPLPNIEDPFNEIKKWKDKPMPAGFGFISPSWQPRISYAGTYDKKWEEKKMPFLPDDFDNRFFNSAHPDLITKEYLKGDEEVDIYNLHPEKRRIRFKLPSMCIDVSFNIQGDIINAFAALDTLLIEPDQNRFTLLWRASAACFKKGLYVNSVTFEYKKGSD